MLKVISGRGGYCGDGGAAEVKGGMWRFLFLFLEGENKLNKN